MSNITALAPWFGSKRTLAPVIVRALGEHKSYWEPFCGSMAVLLAKPLCTMETVNDLHGDIINLARVIQCPEMGPMLYRMLRRTLASRSVFDTAKEQIRLFEDWNVEQDNDTRRMVRAYWYFVVSWLGMNGVAGTRQHNPNMAVRYTHNGGAPAKRFRSAVDSIPSWRRRMANVFIESIDAFEMIAKIGDQRGASIYVDPPYLDKGAKYLHDFEREDTLTRANDHRRLAEMLSRFKNARVVLSYYEHPELDDLYPDWHRVSVHTNKAMVSSGKRDKGNDTVAPEVLLSNHDITHILDRLKHKGSTHET